MTRLRLHVATLLHPLWQLCFSFLPLLLLVCISFWTVVKFQLVPGASLVNYRSLLKSPLYFHALTTSLWLAASNSLLAALIATPLAYAIAFHIPDRWQRSIIFSLLLPSLSSYVVRMFSWQPWLNDKGLFSFGLKFLGLKMHPIIYTPLAIRIGLLSVLVPISSLVIYLGLLRIPPWMHSTAKNLGASDRQFFLFLALPFVWPGFCAALMISFILSFGDFVAVSTLGGNQVYTLSMLVSDAIRINDWPTAAAIATTMIVISVLAILGTFSLLRLTPTLSRKEGEK